MLTGGIPPFLGNITSMESFSVNENPLNGSIPETLSNWKNLIGIFASGCGLHGTIPHSLFNLSLLTNISLAGNQLTGSLSEAIGAAQLPNLAFFQLRDNQFTGPLPASISNFSSLQLLELSRNNFRGKLTVDFSKLVDINAIYIDYVNFGSEEADEMKFIDSLKNCTRLQTLDLSNCNFQGELPISIGNLPNQLNNLYLHQNHLRGNIPSSIGNLIGLADLRLQDNHFTGNIPSTIGKLQNLGSILLGGNQLSGKIPDAIGNVSSLITLSLSSNKLEGPIPSSIGNCRKLIELDLSDNELNGNIPTQLLQLSSLSIRLVLSRNNLSGPLPIEVGDLKALSILDLSENNLSGNIPSSLSDCASLTNLSLKGNQFQGMIPPSLISMKGLLELDLSENNLSGQIPRFLEELRFLNLSYNILEGEVPTLGVFTNLSAFSITGNSRLCSGIVELGLHKCKDSKKGKKEIPVFVIVILVAFTLFTVICLVYAWCKKKRKSQQSELSRKEQFLQVSYAELLKATNGFHQSNLIGTGGFSSVYNGILHEHEDRHVAVKVLHLSNRGAQRSFMRECEAWQNIRHRNVLKIITSCSSVDFKGNDFKALVYEFMPNGSLHDWLRSRESSSSLNFVQMINILMDVASTLDYIHHHCVPVIVHGDLKPSNILLDDDMVAHVGDFGLARFLGISYDNNSNVVRGTIGYAPPEYGLANEMTSSGDVYSFGISLLEMMTRKKHGLARPQMVWQGRSI